MKNLLLLILLAPLLANSATFPSKESARSGEHCKSEWTKRGQLDQRMYDYCMKKEGEGYAEALILMEKYKNQPWIQDAINFSIKEWTKAGVRQDSMVKFSMAKMGCSIQYGRLLLQAVKWSVEMVLSSAWVYPPMQRGR